MQKHIKLSSVCTAFQAKLKIISMALNAIKCKFKSSEDIIINTIDNSVISAIKERNSTNPLIFAIYCEYYDLKSKNMNVFMNKSDSNCDYIIKAGVLAKTGSQSHNSYAYDMITKSVIKKEIYKKNIIEWNHKWSESTTGSHTKKFFPTVRD